MNNVDTIPLIHIGLLCHLVSAEDHFDYKKILAITFEVMIMFPVLCFILFLIMKSSRLQKTLKSFYQKCKSCVQGRRDEEQEEFSSQVNSPSIHQVLIEPITLGDNNYYGAV
jgi:hypothetical protein